MLCPSFTIDPRPATWTTDPNSKTYGNPDPNPLTTGSGSGFVDAVTASYSRVAGESVANSPYHISATLNAAAGVLANYSITNAGAAFTIDPRPATSEERRVGKACGSPEPNPQTKESGSRFIDAVTARYRRREGEK